FVDLPETTSRIEIFAIHLRKRKLNPDNFDLSALAAAAAGFSGAEIEQAIVSALYAASAENAAVAQAHVVRALRETRPLSVLMAEQVCALREWAKERTVSAD